MTRREHLAWAAGFFEGEGCISSCESRPRAACKLRINVAQVDAEPLNRLKELFGGYVCRQSDAHGRYSAVMQWCLTGSRACEFLLDILPFVTRQRVKDRIKAAVAYICELPVSHDRRARSDAFKSQIKALNSTVAKR